MPNEIILEFIQQYGLSIPVKITPLPRTTSGNDSYIIDCNSDKYVLRHLVRQSKESAESEARIQQILNRAGISTPIYLKNKNGKYVSRIGNQLAVVSGFVQGSKQEDDTLELAHDMGLTLARIHDTLQDMAIPFNQQQWFHPHNTEYQLEIYNGQEKEFIKNNTSHYANILKLDLPMALTHGDFHTNNIFSKNDTVTAVFDFESAAYTVRILDIARTYLTYVKVTNLPSAQILQNILDGYNRVAIKPLSDFEKEKLHDAFIYVALVSAVSIYNHGNTRSSAKYLEIAKELMND